MDSELLVKRESDGIMRLHAYMCIHQVLLLFSAIEMHGTLIATYITKQHTTKTHVEDAAALTKGPDTSALRPSAFW